MNCRRRPVRRSHSPGVIRPPRVDLPAAGVGIASQNPFFERISGPVSWAPTMAEPHHGAAFFDLLDKVMPDWERRKQRLERAMA